MFGIKRLLTGCLLAFSVTVFVSSTFSQVKTAPLNGQDIQEIRNYLFLSNEPYDVRLNLLSTVTFLLSGQYRLPEARSLVIEFIEDAQSQLKPPQTAAAVPPELLEAAKNLDEGKPQVAREAVRKYITGAGAQNPSVAAALLALRTGDMPIVFRVLFAELGRKEFSPFSAHVAGILAVRNQRFPDAERYLKNALENKADPRFERWAKTDYGKLLLLAKQFGPAKAVFDSILKDDPNNAFALYWKAFLDYSAGNKEQARVQLTKVVPLLYPDPNLVLEAVGLALHLDELETAASIMEKFEPLVEPNREFFETFAIVRQAQNRKEDATALLQKARQAVIEEFPISAEWVNTQKLTQVLDQSRQKRRREVQAMAQADALSKAYLLLLELDAEGAMNILKQAMTGGSYAPHYAYVLSTLQRRMNDIEGALKTLEDLYKSRPDFRTYQVLTALADYCARTGKVAQAETYYKTMQEKFPGSYQAETARLYLELKDKAVDKKQFVHVAVSPFLSRYSNYSASFVITEMMRHWGDHTTFAQVNSQLRTSPRRGLQFNELFAALLKGTRYQMIPFVGTMDVTSEFLSRNIPVFFCEGEMFAAPTMYNLSLLNGFDASRKVVYAEGVISAAPNVLTEAEVMQGVCVAVMPASFNFKLTDSVKESAVMGQEFLALNAAAAVLQMKQKSDAEKKIDTKKFVERKSTLPKETARGFLPLQLGLLKYLYHHETPEAALAAARQMEKLGEGSAQFWFEKASIEFRLKKGETALPMLDEAVKRQPGSIRFILSKARVLDKAGKTGDAVKMTEALRDQYPEDATVSAHLMAFYKKAGKENEHAAEETRLKNLLHVETVEINLNSGF